jgi:hypothetical protein
MTMNRRLVLVCACVLLAVGAVFFLGSEGTAQVQPPKPKPIPAAVIGVPELMNLFNKPFYMHLKKELAEEPRSDKDWKEIEDRGLQAAEIANLIAMRKAKEPQAQWLQLSGNLQDAGLLLAAAAKNKDWKKTQAASQGLVQRCNECHQTRAPNKAPILK